MNDNDILIKVCCDVFESLSFMFSEAIDLDEVDSESKSFINVFISYKGDRAGAIILIFSDETAKILPNNILGIDEDEGDLPSEPSMDVLKELLNTICGQFITSMFGEEPVFDLTVPETKIILLDEWQESVDSGNFLALNVDDEPILIKSIIE